MKKLISIIGITTFMVVTFIFAQGIAQTVRMRPQNVTIVNSKTFTFELYMTNTWTGNTFVTATSTYSIHFNKSILGVGATSPTVTVISTGLGALATFFGTPTIGSFATATPYMRFVPPASPSLGYVIPLPGTTGGLGDSVLVLKAQVVSNVDLDLVLLANFTLRTSGIGGTQLYQNGSSPTNLVPNSNITFINYEAPLPVQLASFTGNIENKRDVKLTWKTSTETNNRGFEIERKLTDGTWSKIGYIDGKGTTNTPVDYTFEDKKLNTGKYNYRLKQIDNNGNYEYHNLATVIEVGIPTKYDMSQNYPNPFNPTTKIDFDLPLDSRVSIILYDISGREVKTLVNDQRTAGYYTIQFNSAGLSSGTYFYRIMTKSSGQDFIMTKKMMLVK